MATKPRSISRTPSTGRHQPGFPASWMRWYGRPSGAAGAFASPAPVVMLPPSSQRRLQSPERPLGAEQLQRLEQRRTDPAPGDRDPDRAERVARLEPHAVDQGLAESGLDRLGGPLVEPRERVVRRPDDVAPGLVDLLAGHERLLVDEEETEHRHRLGQRVD